MSTAPADRATHTEAFLRHIQLLGRRFRAATPHEIREAFAAVTPHQLDALCALEQQHGGMTMNELARSQGCALSTATALADRLVCQQLAERKNDPDDRRIVRIAPTESATQLVATIRAVRQNLGSKLLSPLSDAEVSKLASLLKKITHPEEVHA